MSMNEGVIKHTESQENSCRCFMHFWKNSLRREINPEKKKSNNISVHKNYWHMMQHGEPWKHQVKKEICESHTCVVSLIGNSLVRKIHSDENQSNDCQAVGAGKVVRRDSDHQWIQGNELFWNWRVEMVTWLCDCTKVAWSTFWKHYMCIFGFLRQGFIM